MKWLRDLLFGKDLVDVLNATRNVRVQGARFEIKKIDPLAHIDGSMVMRKHYAEYKDKKELSPEQSADQIKHLRAHYRDVFMASVVYPRLARKNEDAKDGALFVDNLMTDIILAHQLYEQIMAYSYGKKKVTKPSTLPGLNS